MSSSVLIPAESTKLPSAALARLFPGVVIFLGAFLLFQVEPIIAKMILPWFGGSAVVWTACMLFFQIALLFGYSYAHLVSTYSGRAAGFLHVGLLAASLALLPLIPEETWKPAGSDNPLPRILGLLAMAVGLPYFLLSSTGPLVQVWHVRRFGGGVPYRFFALSNLASLLALLSYPLLVEPWIPSHSQGVMWSWAYTIFACLLTGLTLQSAHLAAGGRISPRFDTERPIIETTAPTGTQRTAWIVLPVATSCLLLATTNHLCQNIAVVPFLWILPLTLYLLSFILCFDHPRWYRRGLMLPLCFGILALTGYLLIKEVPGQLVLAHVALYSACLFLVCMYCHGELVLRKPGPEHLTQFYLMIALGGAVGAVLVGVAAPVYLKGVYEFPFGLAACGMIILMLEYRKSWQTDIVWAALAVWLLVVAGAEMRASAAGARLIARSFYGSVRVTDGVESGTGQPQRSLIHGVISHGTQLLTAGLQREPTGYYARGSGIGMALRGMGYRPLQVGVIGLGAGTMAAYGRPGDEYRFYELDPLIIEVARREFSFLSDSRANVEVVAGDGRLALERETGRRFDLLAVDAFSGDSIPVHLLSREAFQLYLSRLTADGLLAIHVSNSLLDLVPVVDGVARNLGKVMRVADVQEDSADHRSHSVWVVVAADPSTLDHLPDASKWVTPPPRALRVWTDDFSNVFQILK
ncbi:MAG: fused MFS/spermidine synthase [Bryobacteraceae bacterium]